MICEIAKVRELIAAGYRLEIRAGDLPFLVKGKKELRIHKNCAILLQTRG